MCYFYKLIKTQKALYLFNLIPKTYDVKPLKKKKIIVFERCEIRILRLVLHQSSRKYKKMDSTNTTSILCSGNPFYLLKSTYFPYSNAL